MRPAEHTPATTPSQTVGPFLHLGLVWPDGPYVVSEDTPGAIWLRGRITDEDGAPVTDALVETWQADADGRFGTFRGFGRCPTDADGEYGIRTVKPGPVPFTDGRAKQAPHVAVTVFGRGLLRHLVTRLYFADEEEANAVDPVLAGLSASERRTLLATPCEDGYRFDIRLRGDDETVFFAV